MDLLLYFALSALATIVIVAGLAWLTRHEKVEIIKSVSFDDSPIQYEFKETVYMAYDKPYKPTGWKTAKDILENEDTRPMVVHEDSFSHDELWEAAAKMHRETPAEKATIDRWERDALNGAGKE